MGIPEIMACRILVFMRSLGTPTKVARQGGDRQLSEPARVSVAASVVSRTVKSGWAMPSFDNSQEGYTYTCNYDHDIIIIQIMLVNMIMHVATTSKNVITGVTVIVMISKLVAML